MTAAFSADLERSVLCSLFLDPASFGEIADLASPDLFGARGGHQEVATALFGRLRDGKPVDPVLLAVELKAAGRIPDPVPDLLIPDILGADRGDLRAHTEALANLRLQREAHSIGQELLRESAEPVEAVLARVTARLSTLQTSQRPPSRLLSEIIAERVDELERQAKGERVGLAFPTGLEPLDQAVGGLYPGHLVTIAARPGAGKTALVSRMADNLAEAGIPVTIFQLEDYGSALANRAISRRARIPSPMLRDGAKWQTQHWERVTKNVLGRRDIPLRVDDGHGRTIVDIAGAMRRDAYQHRTKVYFLDNLAEVILGGTKGFESRLDRELGVVARTFRDTAHSVGAAAVLCVHLNREVERRENQEPRLFDLKNSGDLEDASHVVLMLHRPPGDPTQLVVSIEKNRNGPRTRVYLGWNPETMSVEG